MPEYERQHYVPRFLLNQFANKNNQLLVYDKQTKKVFQKDPYSLCQESYFYNVPLIELREEAGFLPKKSWFKNAEKEVKEKAFIENVFHGYETKIDKILKDIISKYKLSIPNDSSGDCLFVDDYNNTFIEEAERKELCFFISSQLYRTKKFRNYLIELTQDFFKKFNMNLNFGEKRIKGKDSLFYENQALEFHQTNDFYINASYLHGSLMFDLDNKNKNAIQKFAEILFKQTNMVIEISEFDNSNLLSDDPVTVVKGNNLIYGNFANIEPNIIKNEVIISCSITPYARIVLYGKNLKNDSRKHKNQIIMSESENNAFIHNSLCYMNAERYVLRKERNEMNKDENRQLFQNECQFYELFFESFLFDTSNISHFSLIFKNL